MPAPLDPGDVLDPDALARLRRLVRDRKDRFLALLAAFRDETPELLAAMRTALTAGSAAPLRDAAHTLKGTALSLGAQRLTNLCADLEERGAADRLEGADALLIALAPEVQRLAEALQAECQEVMNCSAIDSGDQAARRR